MSSETVYVNLGKVGRAKGLKGQFFISMHDESSDFFEYANEVYIGHHPQQLKQYTIESIKFEKGRYLLSLSGIEDRTSAEQLLHQNVFYPRKDLPELEEGEVYVEDLVGLEVYDQKNNAYLGSVLQVIDSKAHEILCIVHDDKEWLCPFHEVYIAQVDLEQRKIWLKDWEALYEI